MTSKTVSPKPVWCGACDKRTRLIDLDTSMARCPRCHPLNLTYSQSLPDWCGVCDKRTRHYLNGRTRTVTKCRACHPQKR